MSHVHLMIKDWEEFSKDVANEWMKIPGARPHWAKYCQHIPNIEEYIRKTYGNKIDEFLNIRKELNVDPKDIFYTNWLANIFEPERYPKGYVHKPKTLNSCNCTLM